MTKAGGICIAEAMARRGELASVSDSPELDVALLLCHCLDQPRAYLYTWPERQLTAQEQAEFETLLARRRAGEPVAHLLGYREFWSLPLEVSPVTLIPRPDTECVVEKVLALLADQPPGALLDLGTGTGAIALALAGELPRWEVLGVDCVAEAVALAQRNARRLAMANARFRVSDWFVSLSEGDRFQLIVSNPPYIPERDPHLERGDVRFEPRSALVAAEQGLADLCLIVEQAPAYLHDGGYLVLEHGYNQAADVADMLQARGFVETGMGCDYGGNPRLSWGRWFTSGKV